MGLLCAEDRFRVSLVAGLGSFHTQTNVKKNVEKKKMTNFTQRAV